VTLASWIVVALVVIGLVLLVGIAVPLLPKLRRLASAMKGLQGRAAEAQALQAELLSLQTKAAALQQRAGRASTG
jgi:hypothetical protein